MTALCLADAREAADLAAFLGRLLHYDRRSAVRLRAGAGAGAGGAGTGGSGTATSGVETGDAGVLAVFGRPASFEVLAVRTARLVPGTAAGAESGSGAQAPLDRTVSAGQLADAIDAALATARPEAGASGPAGPAGHGDWSSPADSAGAAEWADSPDWAAVAASRGRGLVVRLPEAATGPPWAGVLPPRGGWRRVEGLPGPEAIRSAVGAAVAEFRARTEALPEARRTRGELDRIGRDIWSRTLGDTGLPLRAVHAAQSLGFLRPPPAGAEDAGNRAAAVPVPHGTEATATASPAGHHGAATALAPGRRPEELALLAAGGWLRLRTPYGSVAVRRTGAQGLSLTPA